jgi:hypothetical protein
MRYFDALSDAERREVLERHKAGERGRWRAAVEEEPPVKTLTS